MGHTRYGLKIRESLIKYSPNNKMGHGQRKKVNQLLTNHSGLPNFIKHMHKLAFRAKKVLIRVSTV